MSVSRNLAEAYEFAPQPPELSTTEPIEPAELAEVIPIDRARSAEESLAVPEDGELAEVISISRARSVGELATDQEREDTSKTALVEAEEADEAITEETVGSKGLIREVKNRGGGGGKGSGSWWECGCGCKRMAKFGRCRYTYG